MRVRPIVQWYYFLKDSDYRNNMQIVKISGRVGGGAVSMIVNSGPATRAALRKISAEFVRRLRVTL